MSPKSVNDFVSKKIDSFTVRDIGEVARNLPQYRFWYQNFALNRTFKNSPPDQHAALAAVLLRKVYGAIKDYDAASEYLNKINKSIKYDQYFSLLDSLETCVYKLYTAMDLARKATSSNIFVSGDDSPEDRLNSIYNKCKHEVPDELDVVWLENDGVSCDSATLRFDELRIILIEYGNMIEKILAK